MGPELEHLIERLPIAPSHCPQTLLNRKRPHLRLHPPPNFNHIHALSAHELRRPPYSYPLCVFFIALAFFASRCHLASLSYHIVRFPPQNQNPTPPGLDALHQFSSPRNLEPDTSPHFTTNQGLTGKWRLLLARGMGTAPRTLASPGARGVEFETAVFGSEVPVAQVVSTEMATWKWDKQKS